MANQAASGDGAEHFNPLVMLEVLAVRQSCAENYPGTPTPEWDEVRRLTAEWLKERQRETGEETSDE